MPTDRPGADCYYCERRTGRPTIWTCPDHRSLEAYALVVAEHFLRSQRGKSEAESTELFEWLASDEGMAAKEATGDLWPENLDAQSYVPLSMMTIGLTKSLVSEANKQGKLRSLASLHLDGAERVQRLQGVLDDVREDCKRKNTAFTLETNDGRGATFRVTGGDLTMDDRFLLSVDELGRARLQVLPAS